jgi:hypothetical protein
MKLALQTSAAIGREHEVAIEDHTHQEPRAYRDRGLDVEIAPYDLLAGLIQTIATTLSQRLNDSIVAVGCAEFRAYAQNG